MIIKFRLDRNSLQISRRQNIQHEAEQAHQAHPLVLVQNKPPPNTPADSHFVRKCYLCPQAVPSTIKVTLNSVTQIFCKYRYN